MKKFLAAFLVMLFSMTIVTGCTFAFDIDEEVPTQINDVQVVPLETIDKSELNIYFMYVGQADSILVDCNGEYALVDCGNKADGPEIINYLKELGVTKLKYLIISHPHEDHMGAGEYVVKNIEIENCIMPDREVNTKVFEKFVDALLDKEVNTVFPNVNDVYKLGEGTFTVLSCDNDADNLNDTSVVTLFTYGENDILLTGDATTKIESEILDWYTFDDIEVLKLGHHGSKSSTGQKYLDAVNPEVAVISVGINNDYGHPTDAVINRINKKNVTLYRTDAMGTIIMTADKENYNFFIEGSRHDGDSDGSVYVDNGNSNGGCSKEDAQYCASVNGGKYHKLDCSYAAKINEDNIVYFQTEDDAIDAGYEACSHCLN